MRGKKANYQTYENSFTADSFSYNDLFTEQGYHCPGYYDNGSRMDLAPRAYFKKSFNPFGWKIH